MLLPDNIHPEDSIYFNASYILNELSSVKSSDIIELYQNVKAKKDIVLPVFLLCLDWLYLINVVEINKDGIIEKCS